MPFVKMISEDPARSNGRVRVRILDESTNKLVTYPSGRVRWFASEEAADEWIKITTDRACTAAARILATSGERFTRSFRPRNYRSRP